MLVAYQVPGFSRKLLTGQKISFIDNMKYDVKAKVSVINLIQLMLIMMLW